MREFIEILFACGEAKLRFQCVKSVWISDYDSDDKAGSSVGEEIDSPRTSEFHMMDRKWVAQP